MRLNLYNAILLNDGKKRGHVKNLTDFTLIQYFLSEEKSDFSILKCVFILINQKTPVMPLSSSQPPSMADAFLSS